MFGTCVAEGNDFVISAENGQVGVRLIHVVGKEGSYDRIKYRDPGRTQYRMPVVCIGLGCRETVHERHQLLHPHSLVAKTVIQFTVIHFQWISVF